MDNWIDDASHCKDAADDRANINHELSQVFSGVGVVDSDGVDFVVEHDDVFLAAQLMVHVHLELEYFCWEPVPKAEIALEDWWDSRHGERWSKLLREVVVTDHFKGVERMLDVGVGEAAFYPVETCSFAEAYVVDLKCVV